MAHEGSVTRWIDPLRAGDSQAAQKLWERYFEALVHLAAKRLRHIRRAAADEEDAALSAFHSFCQGARDGRFPDLRDRGDLWRLLWVITERKALRQIERQGYQKRGGGKARGESVLCVASSASPDAAARGDRHGLDQFMGHEPTPEVAAILAEECQRLLACLGDEMLRQVALWKMEGYRNDEIAKKLGCVTRTVERKLDLIRKKWSEGASR
ncbi:MAG: RNA polymerase subunit sigma-70 [Planctomycetes bacterium]|nr:RNA polymerase subunit sigma-70 [Planctomycetota bacterium]